MWEYLGVLVKDTVAESEFQGLEPGHWDFQWIPQATLTQQELEGLLANQEVNFGEQYLLSMI